MIPLVYLDHDLTQSLRALASNALLSNGPTKITFEVFLAALCESHPREMRQQFRNPEQIAELIRKHKPNPLRLIEPSELADLIGRGAAAAGVELPSDDREATPAFSVRVEAPLLAVLESAVRLAHEASLARAGIPQFVQAASSEKELIAKLLTDTGLILRTSE